MIEDKEVSLIHVLQRHWRQIVLITAACVCLAGLINHLLPHKYESEMKFLVNNERADLVINPGKDQNTAPPAEVTETEVNSEIELLRSHDILERIVLDHKLYLRFQRHKSDPPSRMNIERARQRLEKALTVSALPKSNIIDISYRDPDPESAVTVLREVGNLYLASHLLAHSAPGTDRFFSQQVEESGASLARTRAALAAFHQQQQLFSMPQQQTALVERLESLSSQLKDVDAQIHVQETRLAESNRQLAGVPERVVTQVKQIPDQLALQQLDPMLAQLENRRIELMTKFRPGDRLVVEVDNQLASTRQEMARLRAERMNEETTDLDVLHQSIKSDYVKSRIDLEGLKTQRAELDKMRRDSLQQLGRLDQAYVTLQNLEQRESESQDTYLLYTHRLEEARLAEALDRNKFSNVVMIEKPVASPIPVSPKLALNLAAGFLVGLFGSYGLAFVREVRQSELIWASASIRSAAPHPADSPFQVVSGD